MDTNATTPDNAHATPEKDQQKKYIRTFEGDMATFKKSGIPDLAPLAKARPVKVEFPIPPPPLPIPKPEQKPEPEPLPEPEPPLVVPPEQVRPTQIKTYASDFADRIKETHASTATVLAAEQDSLQGALQTTPQESSRSGLLYGIAGVALLIAGIVGAYVAYTRYGTIMAPIVFAPSVSAPIFVDDREQVSGGGPILLQTIEQSLARPIIVGSIRLLYATSTKDVFSALPASAPDILLRNVRAAGSMAGVVNVDGRQSPFFILSVLSYSNTFSGMLSWEPLIRRNLKTLFPPYPTATSTMTLAPTAFTDEVVANHDVRIYRDAAGQSIMLYGYWNQTTLVIARDPSAFTEILQRLATSRAQ